MDKTYPNNGMSYEEAEKLIKQEYGNVNLTLKHYSMDGLTLWFIGEPDKYYQNYIAQMGRAALVINEKQ